MIRSLTILILFIVHTSFSQENKFVIIGGTAHIGNGTVIENATIIINNGKIKEIGHKDSVNYQRENYEIIDGMGKMSFTSRDTARAAKIYNEMLSDKDCSIFLTLATP